MREIIYFMNFLVPGIITMVAIFRIICHIRHRRTGERDANLQQPVMSQAVRQPSTGNMEEFGPVNYYANERHHQKDKWFQFMYRKVNGEWLTYILRMPSLAGRDGNLHLTHRYRNGETYWICYDPQPKTLEDAQIVSRAWADRELEYITTGKPFEKQVW